MLGSIPLLVIPFILYNLGLTGVIGSAGSDPVGRPCCCHSP